MVKEKLIELGLTDEQATEVLKLSKAELDGNYIPKSRFDEINSQLKTAKEDLKTRDSQLEELKKVDVNGLNAEIERLQKENKENAKANEKIINQMKLDNAIEKALTNAKAKNITAVKALLKLDEIKLEGEDVKGLEEQIKRLSEAEDSSFLFDSSKGGGFSGIKPNGANIEPKPITKEQFNKMGYKERNELYNSDKELYDSLVKTE